MCEEVRQPRILFLMGEGFKDKKACCKEKKKVLAIKGAYSKEGNGAKPSRKNGQG